MSKSKSQQFYERSLAAFAMAGSGAPTEHFACEEGKNGEAKEIKLK